MKDDNSDDFSTIKGRISLLNAFTVFVDRHIYYIRYGSYVLAAVGAVLILKSTYAFRKFGIVADIPTEYLRKNAQFHGQVVRVHMPGGNLMVDHTPVIDLHHYARKTADMPLLPVRLAGVELLDDALPWLQDHLTNKHIWFRVLAATDSDNLHCIVTTRKNILQSMVVNREVVKLGLAHPCHIKGIPSSKYYDWLTGQLVKAQVYAEKKGQGVWKQPPLKERIKQVPSNLYSSLKDYLKLKFSRDKSTNERKS